VERLRPERKRSSRRNPEAYNTKRAEKRSIASYTDRLGQREMFGIVERGNSGVGGQEARNPRLHNQKPTFAREKIIEVVNRLLKSSSLGKEDGSGSARLFRVVMVRD